MRLPHTRPLLPLGHTLLKGIFTKVCHERKDRSDVEDAKSRQLDHEAQASRPLHDIYRVARTRQRISL